MWVSIGVDGGCDLFFLSLCSFFSLVFSGFSLPFFGFSRWELSSSVWICPLVASTAIGGASE